MAQNIRHNRRDRIEQRIAIAIRIVAFTVPEKSICQLRSMVSNRLGRSGQDGASREALLPLFVLKADNKEQHHAHKVAGVAAAIDAVGARAVYLPPYTPDLNPIELAFSKFKWLVRGAAERTVDGLWRLCGTLLDQFTSQECENYLRHCGYRYSDP